jgi:hypothetical protein
MKEQSDRAAAGDPNPGRMDCYPFVRLFRRWVVLSFHRMIKIYRG